MWCMDYSRTTLQPRDKFIRHCLIELDLDFWTGIRQSIDRSWLKPTVPFVTIHHVTWVRLLCHWRILDHQYSVLDTQGEAEQSKHSDHEERKPPTTQAFTPTTHQQLKHRTNWPPYMSCLLNMIGIYSSTGMIFSRGRWASNFLAPANVRVYANVQYE